MSAKHVDLTATTTYYQPPFGQQKNMKENALTVRFDWTRVNRTHNIQRGSKHASICVLFLTGLVSPSFAMKKDVQ